MRDDLDSRRLRALRYGAAACVATLLLAAGVAAAGPTPEESVLVAAGRQEYRRYCAACHGVGGRGDGPVAASLAVPVPDLTRIARHNGGSFPAGEVAVWIDGRTSVDAHGTRTMPVWGKRLSAEIQPDTAEEVTRGRISLLVAYLQSIQR